MEQVDRELGTACSGRTASLGELPQNKLKSYQLLGQRVKLS
jgi:hypothetical protein